MDERCREVLDNLAVFLDGECAKSLEQVIAQHLGDCHPCLGRADFEQQLRALVASRCKDEAPSGLMERIVDSLRATGTNVRSTE